MDTFFSDTFMPIPAKSLRMKILNPNKGFSTRDVFWAISFLLIFAGCKERQINPLEDERGIYSIYGAMDMDEEQNYIRVKDLRGPLSSNSAKMIDATVLFEDLATGNQKILQDTIVEFSGNYTHNYLLEESLGIRNPYQITVLRSDGQSVSSVATTPGITSASAIPSENLGCYQPLELRFENILPSEQIRFEVRIEAQNEARRLELTRICPLTRIENENTLVLEVIPLDIIGAVFPAPGVNEVSCNFAISDIQCDDLDSKIIHFDYLHLGPEWQAVFPLYPVDPEDIGDVNNGLGFFGAYREDSFSFTVTTED